MVDSPDFQEAEILAYLSFDADWVLGVIGNAKNISYPLLQEYKEDNLLQVLFSTVLEAYLMLKDSAQRIGKECSGLHFLLSEREQKYLYIFDGRPLEGEVREVGDNKLIVAGEPDGQAWSLNYRNHEYIAVLLDASPGETLLDGVWSENNIREVKRSRDDLEKDVS